MRAAFPPPRRRASGLPQNLVPLAARDAAVARARCRNAGRFWALLLTRGPAHFVSCSDGDALASRFNFGMRQCLGVAVAVSHSLCCAPAPRKKTPRAFFFCIAHLRVQGNFYTVGTWPLFKDFFLRPSHIQQTGISQQAIYFCSCPCRNPGSAWFLFAKHIDLHFCITFSTVIISLKVVFIVPYAKCISACPN